jgi:hypothetical protein
MRVKIRPCARDTRYSRQARTARSIAALCLGTAGCADVLDLPDHPRLEQETAASPRPARAQQAATPESDVASSGENLTARRDADVAARPGEGQPTSSRSDESGPNALSGPSPQTQQPETADAGAPPTRPAPLDATSPADPTPAAVCAASGVVGPNGSCFATLATARTWVASRESCRALGAGWDLASIRSAEVNRFLTELLTGETWIGASDGRVEGTWIWVDDGTAFWRGDATGNALDAAFPTWSRSQPNGEANADCARLVPDAAGVWGDLPCAELRAAVCEGPTS